MSKGWNLGSVYLSIRLTGRRYKWEISAINDETICMSGHSRNRLFAFEDALDNIPRLLSVMTQAQVDKRNYTIPSITTD